MNCRLRLPPDFLSYHASGIISLWVMNFLLTLHYLFKLYRDPFLNSFLKGTVIPFHRTMAVECKRNILKMILQFIFINIVSSSLEHFHYDANVFLFIVALRSWENAKEKSRFVLPKNKRLIHLHIMKRSQNYNFTYFSLLFRYLAEYGNREPLIPRSADSSEVYQIMAAEMRMENLIINPHSPSTRRSDDCRSITGMMTRIQVQFVNDICDACIP